ncbi:outer membrane protein assembly factor [Flammeovirga yaeyamensis]|uniref:Outer membrane protein assembly factor n=1 Tax=Flammeovirga yaeyamensis TaxID=367791 RepID=A0AAX1N8H5_9BACT|nr:BamA/TamA family outer membrane protein [Flammeovirga yaeyamensis]MBB3701488.1 hypothetical protein [Flammeovirga yaeyamensis]NMF38611.1 hypothetical protein [Flammeovirga yaeyamensis]QWG02726.1 outer membrane protein assembly factor [Flammeovirga yaeyamensis]
MKFVWVHIIILVLCINQSIAQTDSTSLRPYKNNILASPALSYSPKTDVVLGLYFLYQFKLKKDDYATRPSNVNFYVGSSYKGQNYLSTEHELLSNGEKYYFKGKIEYKKTPEQLYRIGPDTGEDDFINAEYHSLEIFERVVHQFRPNMFIGGKFRSISIFDINYTDQEGKSLDENSLPFPGAEGGSYLGIGPVFIWDKRNSIMTPTRNFYLDLTTLFYTSLDDSRSFITLKLDGRRYFDLKNNGQTILACQLLVQNNFGDIPFHELSLLGGKQIMRGYELGRYRDFHSIQTQAELRQKVWGRFGMTAFYSLGTVYDELSDFQHLKSTLGAGLRLNINRKDPANVRVDFGWSLEENNKGIYITLGEAF